MNTINSENSFFTEVIDKDLILALRRKFGDTSTLDADKLTKEEKKFFSELISLVEDESISIEYLVSFVNNSSSLDSLKEAIENIYNLREIGRLSTKTLGLYQQFNIQVYTETYKQQKNLKNIAYKNIGNIKEEVNRMYNYTFNPSPLEVNIDPLKFLNINGCFPTMLTSKEVIFFSFILNYSGSLINKLGIMEDIFDIAEIDPSSLDFDLSNSTASVERWDELGSLYYKFLTYLKENTLN